MTTIHHGGIGNTLARLHDEAQRVTMVLPDAKMRRCKPGGHLAANKGGAMIGRMWCCAACKGMFK